MSEDFSKKILIIKKFTKHFILVSFCYLTSVLSKGYVINGKLGIAKASYYADTSISRLNRDLDNSVDRVATAKKNVTASDIASLKSMDYSFRLDFAATKAAVKSMSVTQAYLSLLYHP